MGRGSVLCAYLVASFLLLCTSHEIATFSKKLEEMLDQDGNGQVSTNEVSSALAVWAPEKTSHEHKAISQVVYRILLEKSSGSFNRPSNDAAGLFGRDDVRVPVSTCLERIRGHVALCTDLNADGFVDRSEVRQNQVALYILNTAVSQKLSVADIAIVNGPSSDIDKVNAAASICAPSSTDTFWEWRSNCAENSRISDTWIVPLINDPRSLLIWLRFFDSSSFLDLIDDEHVEKSSLPAFAFTWVFVPSYPIFRMVQNKISAFSTSSIFGCDVNEDHDHKSSPELNEALDLASRGYNTCKGIADLILQNRHLLCMKETPTRTVFPTQSIGSISHEECLLRTKGNSAECFAPHNSIAHGQLDESHEQRLDLSQLEKNTHCIYYLKDSIKRQQRDLLGSAIVFFLFLRFLCEGWSFITLILWFRGIYRTPRFGLVWIMSIAKHMLGTAFVGVIFYYFLWHTTPFFIISSVSYIFIYFIWPLGSLVLAYTLIIDGLKPATAAVINAASPRPKAPCRSPAPPMIKNPFVDGLNDSSAKRAKFTPKRRGSGARPMSPIELR